MNRKSRAMLVLGGALLLVGLVFWLAYLWTTRSFYNVNILTIFLYLTNPLTGVEKRYLFNAGLLLVVVVLAFVLGMMWIRRRVVRYGAGAALVFLIVSAAVFSSSLFAIENRFQVIAFVFPPEPYSTYIDDHYRMFDPEELVFENGANNLVLVILESMENTFTDEKLFSPGIMPACSALEREAIVFRGHRQCLGTEFSLSGFVSMMLGVPTKPKPSIRDVVMNILGEKEADNQITAERDLSDYSVIGLLERKGFNISFLTGADVRFAGFLDKLRSFTRQCEIRDLLYFQERREDVAAERNGWGFYDSFLYDRAKELLSEQSPEEPFCVLIQTLDTHIPGFYEPEMRRPYGDARDTFFQADAMLRDFLGWIREQPFAENTTVAFVGDHLYPGEAVGPVTLPSRRGIMCMLFNARGRPGPENIRRTFATFDVAPTLLEAVGGTFPGRRLGLGVSLFSPQRTLLEKDELDTFNYRIMSRSKAHEERYGW